MLPGVPEADYPDSRDVSARTGGGSLTDDDLIQRGKRIAESGKYSLPLGLYLGRIEAWGLDVYENSPQQWIDALLEEASRAE
jgi:hypothetical protein